MLLLFVASCKKSDNESDVAERGKVISKSLIINYPKASIDAGLILSYPEMFGKVSIKYDVDMYSIVYETIDPFGAKTLASGLIAIPKNVGKAVPLSCFQHGTMLNKQNVPSKLGSGSEVGIVFGTEGYVVAMPDFLGLGSGDKLHPYIHAASEATSVIDMLRATRKVCQDLGIVLNNQLFMFGYSQGGHVTMAAHKAIEEKYSSEFTVTACSPMAGPYDLSGTQAQFILQDQPYVSAGYFPYLLYSFNHVYKLFPKIEDIFISPYNTTIPPYFDGSGKAELSAVEQLLPASHIPTDILKPEMITTLKNPTHAFWNALKENDLYDWIPKAPIQMFHCDKDAHVPIANSQKVLQTMKARGVQNVSLTTPLIGGVHYTCLIPSILGALEWFNGMKQ